MTQKQIKPTESELEILGILWNHGPATVREVHDILEKNKSAGYTTTLKLMQIMHEKKLLKRDVSSRSHVYEPAISMDKTRRQIVQRMIDTVFNGSASQLIMQALGHHKAGKEELDQIKSYLEEIERKNKK